MITKRAANERGHLNFGWLDARHSFSFGSYFDPSWMGYRSLRVINEDRIAPTKGFETHPHKNMEILSVILGGELQHKDALGHEAIIRPGEIQMMSAGTGILHSEFNSSSTNETHMLQIWIKPSELNIEPRYEQFKYQAIENELVVIANSIGGENIAKIHQDIIVSVGRVSQDKSFELNDKKYYWLQVIAGSGKVNNIEVNAGDAVALENEKELILANSSDFQFLLFELT